MASVGPHKSAASAVLYYPKGWPAGIRTGRMRMKAIRSDQRRKVGRALILGKVIKAIPAVGLDLPQ